MSMPTERAEKYFRDLAAGKEIPAGRWQERVDALLLDLDRGVDDDTAGRTSRAIDSLKGLPWKPRAAAGGDRSDIEAPGVFMLDRVPYVVRWTRQRQGAGKHLYACELVELRATEGDRSDLVGGRVRFRHEYRAGMMRKLREEHRITGVELEEVMNRYSQCIMCGAGLKLWTSQNQLDPDGNRVMMGDTCYAHAYGRKPDHKKSKAAASAA